MTDISQYTFIPKGTGKIVLTPAFAEGDFWEALYRVYEEVKKSRFDNNPNFRLFYENGQLKDSTIFDSALINEIVKPFGLRTSLPQDLDLILEMLGNKHSTDANALVLRSITDCFWRQNNNIAENLALLIDYQESKGPVLITSLRVEPFPEDSANYGLKLVPSEDSKIIYDDRLSEKYNGWKFDKTDRIGLPENLDKKKGSRIWCTTAEGLSRLATHTNHKGLCLSSSILERALHSSKETNRIVLHGGHGSEAMQRDCQAYYYDRNELLKKANERLFQ